MRVRDSGGRGGGGGGEGGSLRSPHSVTSSSDSRRTHSIFHSSAVDGASALSLVTQQHIESAESVAENSLSRFLKFGFKVLFIVSSGRFSTCHHISICSHVKYFLETHSASTDF